MKRFLFFVVLVNLLVSPIHCATFSEISDSIKKSVVSFLPKSWQKKADTYFWPTVGVCATTLAALVIYSYKKTVRDPREIFTDFLYEVRENNPPITCRLTEGDYGVAMVAFDEPNWHGDSLVTSATVHLEYRSKQLCAYMLRVPFASLDNPSVREIVDVAMERLAECLAE